MSTRGSQLLSSRTTDEWKTPQKLFLELRKEFRFTLDAAATKRNAKCRRYFTKRTNALKQRWGGAVFCNPPYSLTGAFLRKGKDEVAIGRARVCVFLINANTDTGYFHEMIYDRNKHKVRRGVNLRFIKGRLRFNDGKNPSMRPSMLVIFKRGT
jgi:phage N-6-adenine-methyltransferase